MGKRAAATLFFTVSFFQMYAVCQCAWKQGLQCYSCTFNQSCSDSPSVVACKEGDWCGVIKGNSDYKVHEPIFGMGCIPARNCSRGGNIIHSSSLFWVTYSCCNTSYCNNGISRVSQASTLHLLLLFGATLSAVLATFLS